MMQFTRVFMCNSNTKFDLMRL